MKANTTTASNGMTTRLWVGGVGGPEVSRSAGLRFGCHSWDWLSCPPACREMKAVCWHERAGGARWEGRAHMTGEGEAAGVPSLPPADHTGHDRTA